MKIFSELQSLFLKQNRRRQLIIGGLGLIILVGLIGVLSAIFTRPVQQSPSITTTQPVVNNFGVTDQTPTTTNTAIPFSSATHSGPTQTPLPTGLPTQGFETATLVVLPTRSSASAGTNTHVVIAAVNKELEYVDIQNAGGSPVDLSGWKLVSEVGNQSCLLKGILQSQEVLRIWAGRDHPVGLNCGFYKKIWSDEQIDPAVLYNAKGDEVNRYP